MVPVLLPKPVPRIWMSPCVSVALYSRAAFVPIAAIAAMFGRIRKFVTVSTSGVLSPAVRVIRTVHEVSPAGIPAGTVSETVEVLHEPMVDVALPDGHTKTTVPVVVPNPVPVRVTAPPMTAPVDVAGEMVTMSGYI